MAYEPLYPRKKNRFVRVVKYSLALTALAAIGVVATQMLSKDTASTPDESTDRDGGIPIEVISAIDAPSELLEPPAAQTETTPALEDDATPPVDPDDPSLPAIEEPEEVPPEIPDEPTEPEQHIQTVEIESGMSLSVAFEQADIGYSVMLSILNADEQAGALERLRSGDKLHFFTEPDAEQPLTRLEYPMNVEQVLVVERQDDEWHVQIEELPIEIIEIAAGGDVRGSLYQSAVSAGVPPAQVMQLADIFGWKIDFLRDVRDGDSFKLIYQSRERDGEHLSNGRVVAAEYTNRGETFQAVFYQDDEGNGGYYEPDGSSLERGFLRYPVEFTRISSEYDLERLHPIHGTVREHIGVDLAAPSGTPIHAAGDGEITFQGWKHGYGRVVEIRHDSTYETLYAHMSRFNSNQSRGSRVSKGDVIGYVGMTGDATGPHLHYEFHVNGQHTDPLKVDLPEANQIDDADLDRFKAAIEPMVEAMNNGQFNEPAKLALTRAP